MRIRLNGMMQAVPAGSSVGDMIARVHADARLEGVAVALNGKIIRRADWPATALSDGDEIEVVQAVAGG